VRRVVGVGAMGGQLAGRLLEVGREVHGTNRSASRAQPLIAARRSAPPRWSRSFATSPPTPAYSTAVSDAVLSAYGLMLLALLMALIEVAQRRLRHGPRLAPDAQLEQQIHHV
jgi:ketopantoate reductase